MKPTAVATLAILMTFFLIGCGDKPVPEGWVKLGLPVENGKIHDDGTKQDDTMVSFMHKDVSAHEPLCNAYSTTPSKHGYKATVVPVKGTTTSIDLKKGDASISLTCDKWDTGVLVLLHKR